MRLKGKMGKAEMKTSANELLKKVKFLEAKIRAYEKTYGKPGDQSGGRLGQNLNESEGLGMNIYEKYKTSLRHVGDLKTKNELLYKKLKKYQAQYARFSENYRKQIENLETQLTSGEESWKLKYAIEGVKALKEDSISSDL